MAKNNKYFTNTYITGSGRRNFLEIKFLEEPLFTSFTFDIDFNTSPLFYTISNDTYGYPFNIDYVTIEQKIKSSRYDEEGYDILSTLSADFFEENKRKMGFGLQENVYMDKPLYGATEYIYMVDKRCGINDMSQNDVSQNDVINNNSISSYKLGGYTKNNISESDKLFYGIKEEEKKKLRKKIEACDEFLKNEKNITEHNNNINELEKKKPFIDNGIAEISNYNKLIEEIEKNNKISLKRNICNWVNTQLNNYKKEVEDAHNIYTSNKNAYTFYDTIVEIYGRFISSEKNDNTFLFKDGNNVIVRNEKIIYAADFIKLDINNDDIGNIKLMTNNSMSTSIINNLEKDGNFNTLTLMAAKEFVKIIMSTFCDETSFDKDKFNISSEDSDNLKKYKQKLVEYRISLYGYNDGHDKHYMADSKYGEYIKSKEICDNDEYSQTVKNKKMLESELSSLGGEISDTNQQKNNENPNEGSKSTENNLINQNNSNITYTITSCQSLEDMLGFISGMKSMIKDYPYIIQSVTGLDTAYNKHYGITDPYLGSGDDKITLTCFESLDLRVSSMFNRYFNAVYDRQYRRERVPVNLRRFNCSIYVHDVRNFKLRNEVFKNRMHELTDMYYSAIEFRFYDCEIVPEETGNIFDNISNEAPSEMKKTNFTFKYGNCVVNFAKFA